MNPFLIFSSFRDLAFSSPGQPPVVWGTVGRLVSAASSQLGSRPVNGWGGGEGGGGPVAGKEPDTPAPPGMSGHQKRVTGGGLLAPQATCKQRKSTGMSGDNKDQLKISKEGLLF